MAVARCLPKTSVLQIPLPWPSSLARRLTRTWESLHRHHGTTLAHCQYCRPTLTSERYRLLPMTVTLIQPLTQYELFHRRYGGFSHFSTQPNHGAAQVDDSDSDYDSDADVVDIRSDKYQRSIERLSSIRNVGIFAHVDASKTTVTERGLRAVSTMVIPSPTTYRRRGNGG